MRKIVVFGGDEKKGGKKSKDEYDDSDDEKSNIKGKNVKSKKSRKVTTHYGRKGKR